MIFVVYLILTERTFGEEAEYKLEDIYKVIVDLEKTRPIILLKIDGCLRRRRKDIQILRIRKIKSSSFIFIYIRPVFDVYIRKHIIEKIIDYIDDR